VTETSVDPRLCGIWSATPTPLTDRDDIDEDAVSRLVDRHAAHGVTGLFVGGTCGEGPWLTAAKMDRLLRAVARANGGRMLVAAQATDNSADRIVDNARRAADAGADIAIVAQPYFLLNAVPGVLRELYLDAITRSPLPVGFYDRGRHSAIAVPNEVVDAVAAHPRVVLVKDSTCDPARAERYLRARRNRPALRLFNGDELACMRYLELGYDGLLLGGAALTAPLLSIMLAAWRDGRRDDAAALDARVVAVLAAAYADGCWLSGLKHALVRLGVMTTSRNLLRYPLSDACRAAIEGALVAEAAALAPAPAVRAARDAGSGGAAR